MFNYQYARMTYLIPAGINISFPQLSDIPTSQGSSSSKDSSWWVVAGGVLVFAALCLFPIPGDEAIFLGAVSAGALAS